MNRSDPTVDTLLSQAEWHDERKRMRAILLGCDLVEVIKWGKLCYTFEGQNVAIIYGLKAYCGIGFFKGSLLADPEGILHQQGENSQAVRLIRFGDVAQIDAMAGVVADYVQAAIAIEQAGLKVDFKQKDALVYPAELADRLAGDIALKAAFEALTPGRRRGYVIFFSGAKQSATRAARVEKHAARILAGKGMNDR